MLHCSEWPEQRLAIFASYLYSPRGGGRVEMGLIIEDDISPSTQQKAPGSGCTGCCLTFVCQGNRTPAYWFCLTLLGHSLGLFIWLLSDWKDCGSAWTSQAAEPSGWILANVFNQNGSNQNGSLAGDRIVRRRDGVGGGWAWKMSFHTKDRGRGRCTSGTLLVRWWQ